MSLKINALYRRALAARTGHDALKRLAAKRIAVLAVAAVFSAPVFAQTINLDSEEQAFLGLINDYRAQNGLGALRVSPKLTQASKWMSADMVANNYFSHTDALGRSAGTRRRHGLDRREFGCFTRRNGASRGAGAC